jgi:hypothetical protein
MALLFMDGFSGGDFATKWDTGSGYSRQTSGGRTSGGIYLSSFGGGLRKSFTPGAEIYVGMGFNASANVAVYFLGDAAVTTHLTFQYNSASRVWSIYRGVAATLLATGTTIIPLGTWHYIEMHARISDTVGVAEIRIDGATIADVTYSGDTKNAGTNTSFDSVQVSASGGHNISDFYICDTTGSRNNTWLGDVVVRTLTPNGNGNSSQFVGSDSDSVNNYLLVNEQPVSSAQYTGSPTTGQRDSYTMTDLPAGVTNILGMQLNTYMAKSDATAASGKPLLRTNSTNYYGTTRILGTTYQAYTDVFEINPNTSTAWTATDINGLETGLEVG